MGVEGPTSELRRRSNVHFRPVADIYEVSHRRRMRRSSSRLAGDRSSEITLPQAISALPLDSISKVVFFKRDESTTDLICCEVTQGDQVWFFHEEWPEWDRLIEYLERLPRWRSDWLAAVSQPPFATSFTIAYQR